MLNFLKTFKFSSIFLQNMYEYTVNIRQLRVPCRTSAGIYGGQEPSRNIVVTGPPESEFLKVPKIDSKEPIPPGCVAWRAGTTTLFLLCSEPPKMFKNPSTWLDRPAESIPCRFLAYKNFNDDKNTQPKIIHVWIVYFREGEPIFCVRCTKLCGNSLLAGT